MHTSTVAPNYTLYCATKGAIEQMTKLFSKDLARKGISVNAIAPGPTGTELFFKGKSEQILKTIASFSPHNRIGEPEEIADAIVFFSGEGSRWVTGQVLGVNGGSRFSSVNEFCIKNTNISVSDLGLAYAMFEQGAVGEQERQNLVATQMNKEIVLDLLRLYSSKCYNTCYLVPS